jgi:hypothetical protein
LTWKHAFLITIGATLAAFAAWLMVFGPQTARTPDTLFTIATGIIVGSYGHAKSDKLTDKREQGDTRQ